MPSVSMSFNFSVRDNIKSIKAALSRKLDTAFEALSEEAVVWVQDQMMNGYDEPHGEDGHTEIYDTGALIESIDAKVETKMLVLHKLQVGSPLYYATFVHNGTRKLHGRPFIRDAIQDHQRDFARVIQQAIEDL